jgi:two-component system, response regulator YesN
MPNTILLVDDDKEFREEFSDYFDQYTIIQAGHALEALDILKKPNLIDLVLLDVMMPGPKGTEVIADIRRINPEMPIVILTGFGSKEIVIQSLKGKVNDYIEKPLHLEKTKDIIDKLLEAKQEANQPVYHGNQAKVEKVKQFIERNCFKKITLQDAAAHVFLSPKYLSRIFESIEGSGFNDFKLKIKIGKAKELLEDTDLNIFQISSKLGYQNVESFTMIFKKNTGITPKKYRQNKIRKPSKSKPKTGKKPTPKKASKKTRKKTKQARKKR